MHHSMRVPSVGRQGGPPSGGAPCPAFATGGVVPKALLWATATGGPWPSPQPGSGDDFFMAQALRAAMRGVGLASPNPPVGCVLVKDRRILGAGGHLHAGGPHGEILALAEARALGEGTEGAAVYVTLEPCCHHGRTPPCTEALLAAGITRVVVGMRDPNPRVDGGGMASLRERGVEVQEGVLGRSCAAFHAPFSKWIRTGLPWVVFLYRPGGSDLRRPVARAIFALRRAAEAVVIGRRTALCDPVLKDDWPTPVPSNRQLLRVVMDPGGDLAPSRRVWAYLDHQPVLRATLAMREPLPGVEDCWPAPGPGGFLLGSLLGKLALRGVGRVLIEGGPNLARALLIQGLGDEFHSLDGDPATMPDALLADPAFERQRLPLPGGAWDTLRRRNWPGVLSAASST